MSGLLQYVRLQVKLRTGLSSTVVVWAILAAVCGIVTFVIAIVAADIWLADLYTPLTAALILGAFFLLLTVVAVTVCVIGHRRTVTQATQALALRSNAAWITPQTLAIGLQIGRALGWRRLLALLALGIMAAGLAKEWAQDDDRSDRADDTR